MPRIQAPCQPVADLLARTRLEARQSAHALSLWPLCLREDADPATATAEVESLASALAAGRLRVDELHASGEVPHVRVTNAGPRAVLVLFGEELRGAKQNRIANASFLVPSKGELVIDVSCVEAGRWHRRSGEPFHAAEGVISQRLRAKISGQVARERLRGGRFGSDQREVWHEIGERLRRSRTASATSAYADYRASREGELRAIATAFPVLPRQVGFVAAIGDAVAGAEALASPELFRAEFDALLRAYAIDAVDAAILRGLDERGAEGAARFDDPVAFLAALGAAGATRTRSLGLGDDLRLRGASLAGCALVHGALVHLIAFPAQAAEADAG